MMPRNFDWCTWVIGVLLISTEGRLKSCFFCCENHVICFTQVDAKFINMKPGLDFGEFLI